MNSVLRPLSYGSSSRSRKSMFPIGLEQEPRGTPIMMDWTRFGLRRRPFSATPDSACYYPATGFERALARLHEGLTQGEGLAMLTAAPGLGKTLLGRILMQRLGVAEARCATITNSHLPDRAALLQAILFDLALPFQGLSEQEMRLSLTAHLLESMASSGPVLLLVDEAHHLGVDHLEELRLLGNLEADGTRALLVVLIGQPELLDTLRRPELAGLRQRLALRVELEPLDVHEAADYLLHQIRSAGGRPEDVFTDEAIEALVGATAGVPRLLNQSAYQALTLATEAEVQQVDVEAVVEALALLGLGTEEEAEPRLLLSERKDGEDEAASRESA
jgi:type II secretory pathway predicted ATPase ExeA